MVVTLQRYRIKALKCQLIVAMSLFLGAQAALADGVSIFAAASLREATQELGVQYFDQTGESPLQVFAASSAIARQAANGAPADVLLLADQDWADWLVGQGHGVDVKPFAGNQLVLVSSDEITLTDINELPAALGRDVLAMAQVDTVPAGRYGKSALEAAGLWDVLSPQIVQAANVRAALRFVERAEAPFGIAYASDLTALPELNEVYRFDPDSHVPIVYVALQVTQEGAGFMTYLQSDAAQEILQRWGFAPVDNFQ